MRGRRDDLANIRDRRQDEDDGHHARRQPATTRRAPGCPFDKVERTRRCGRPNTRFSRYADR